MLRVTPFRITLACDSRFFWFNFRNWRSLFHSLKAWTTFNKVSFCYWNFEFLTKSFNCIVRHKTKGRKWYRDKGNNNHCSDDGQSINPSRIRVIVIYTCIIDCAVGWYNNTQKQRDCSCHRQNNDSSILSTESTQQSKKLRERTHNEQKWNGFFWRTVIGYDYFDCLEITFQTLKNKMKKFAAGASLYSLRPNLW